MFLDSNLLSSGAIGDEEGVDTVTNGGNEDVAVFKADPDDDNVADEDKDDGDDCENDDAVATDVPVVIIDKDGDDDNDSGVDCSSGVSAGGCKILPLK